MHENFKLRRPVITTPRLTLRAFKESDLESCLDIVCDKRVSATYMLPDFPERAAAAKLFDRLKTLSEGEDRFVYAIALEDTLIGFLNEVDISGGSVEVGYVVHPDHWNKGYATEALKAVVEELFRLGFTAVRAGYFEGNHASRRVMEKAGMTPTGETEEVEYRGKVRRCPMLEVRK